MAQSSRPSFNAVEPPSDLLVKSLLKRTTAKQSQRLILEKWDELQKKQPAVAQFIRLTSHKMAPASPANRERLASAMIKLYMLIEEAGIQKELTEAWSESLAGYFPKAS